MLPVPATYLTEMEDKISYVHCVSDNSNRDCFDSILDLFEGN
jgi:hypothetical protein